MATFLIWQVVVDWIESSDPDMYDGYDFDLLSSYPRREFGPDCRADSLDSLVRAPGASRAHLGRILAVSRPYLGRISATSRPHLAGAPSERDAVHARARGRRIERWRLTGSRTGDLGLTIVRRAKCFSALVGRGAMHAREASRRSDAGACVAPGVLQGGPSATGTVACRRA